MTWDFVNAVNVIWIRLNAPKHPQLDLTQPISFRVLVLPLGVTNGDLSLSTVPDQTNGTGSSATFNVSAAGTGPLSYQWFFDVTNAIDGATNSSYTASNLTTNDAGRYTVAVGDANGCTNYSTASLSVNTTITPVSMTIGYNGTQAVLNWTGSHTLQSAPAANGPYTDVTGPVLTGPYPVTPSGNALYFRLKN